MALWAGRFKKEINADVNAFNSSISFDARMYKHDIMGSQAHAKMLAKQGIISRQDLDEILLGLNDILQEIEEGKLLFDPEAEDIHMFMGASLTKRYPVSGKKLHTARSRNDQVALDLRLYTRDEMNDIKNMLIELMKVMIEKAKAHTHTIMCGYTHLQRAQPITFAHHLMAYVEMFYRDYTRLEDCLKRMNVSPLGSGALATTTYPIDRMFVAQELGMDDIMYNSLDGVSDRDYAIELANDLAMIMMHLSRLSEEIILWCSWEFKYIELDDAYATGSSIMPQKKNPDACELIRGKTGRVYGDLLTVLSMMKALPLAYNKDMQEDKEALFDGVETWTKALMVAKPMMKTLKVKKDNMLRATRQGFLNATDLADYLVKKGLTFRDSHRLVGEIVFDCIEKGIGLEDISLDDYKAYCDLIGEDIFDNIAIEACVESRQSLGGPSRDQVVNHIEFVRGWNV